MTGAALVGSIPWEIPGPIWLLKPLLVFAFILHLLFVNWMLGSMGLSVLAEIQRAVEAQFKVKVAEVRVAKMHGKVRRQGRFAGRRSDWKKAFVRLAPGEKTIDFFEGA